MKKDTLIDNAIKNGYEIDSNNVRTKVRKYRGTKKVFLAEIAEDRPACFYLEVDNFSKKDIEFLKEIVKYSETILSER